MKDKMNLTLVNEPYMLKLVSKRNELYIPFCDIFEK